MKKTVTIWAEPTSNDWLNAPLEHVSIARDDNVVTIDIPQDKQARKVACVKLIEEIKNADVLIGWNLKPFLLRLYSEGVLGFGDNKPDVFLQDMRSIVQTLTGIKPPTKPWQKNHIDPLTWLIKTSSDIQPPMIYEKLTEPAIWAYAELDSVGIELDNNTKVHTNYTIDGTISGRLTGTSINGYIDPLLMKQTDRAKYVPKNTDNLKFVLFDYNAMEVRVLAALSKCQTMLALLDRHNADFYNELACLLSHKRISKASDLQRRIAKGLCLVSIFGGSSYSIAKQFEVDIGMVEQYQYKFFKIFPEIEEFVLRTKIIALESGCIETITGRKRYFGDLTSIPKQEQDAQLRAAQSHMVQSPANDINILAFLCLQQAIKRFDELAGCRLLFHIHDGYVIGIPEESLAEATGIIIKILENIPIGTLIPDSGIKLVVKPKAWLFA